MDESGSRRAALGGAAIDLVLPTAALVAANVVVGRAITRNSALAGRETDLIRRLRANRSPRSDRLAKVVSTASDVPASIAHGLLAAGLIGWVSKDPRRAAAPALALVLEAVTHLVSGAMVGRARPDLPKLDRDQPTSAYPSGHQGATVALMVGYLREARTVRYPAVRALIRAACLAYPATLAWARVYVGMHYPSDVVVGAANGVTAGLLAGRYLSKAG